MQVVGNSNHSSASSVPGYSNDFVQRKKDFIRRRRHQADENSASKVIEGMTKIAQERNNSIANEESPLLKASMGWKVG